MSLLQKLMPGHQDRADGAVEAVWNDVVIARSDRTIVVEGNHYFPPESVDPERLRPSRKQSSCPWKGEASYHSIEAGGRVAEDAAWYYPAPRRPAAQIKDRIAFWRGVEVRRAGDGA